MGTSTSRFKLAFSSAAFPVQLSISFAAVSCSALAVAAGLGLVYWQLSLPRLLSVRSSTGSFSVLRPYWELFSFEALECTKLAEPEVGPLGTAEPRVAGLPETWSLLLPALGPETSLCARSLCREASVSLGAAALAAAARSGAWSAEYLAATAPPLVWLVAAMAPASAVLRAATLGPLLLPGGASSAWACDARGRPPLVLAAASAPELVSALLRAGAEANQRDGAGWTALMWAAHRGDLQCSTHLLQAGASPNVVSRDGSSALLCAARADGGLAKQLSVVKELLLALADPELVPMHMLTHLEPEVHRVLKEAHRAHAAAGRLRKPLAENG
ncbi:unnamed protein product [Polarella glacialis]|uniref:Uncharacterized protein n=1 Tax=Polarella glacialis TaxID=89957 RepID=A0A813LC49_POLGL|nr:unnamed protein product [Polarella glacialis]